MMKIYRTQDKQLTRVDDMSEGAWICLTSPTDEEVRRVAATLDIEPTDIVAATDPEESARISLEDGYTVIIVDIPIKVDGAGEGVYTTIPLGILLTQELIVTVCSADTAVVGDFAACRVKGFSTRKKMRFVYQLLYRAATMYQQELRLIDRRRQAIEKNLAGELKDSDLMELHALESTLVYFATSLRANATVLDRLTRYKRLEQYPDDRELLDDVIVEIRQAIEMTSIYRDDIKGTVQLDFGQPPEQRHEIPDQHHPVDGRTHRYQRFVRHERPVRRYAVCQHHRRVCHCAGADAGFVRVCGVGAAQEAYVVRRARTSAPPQKCSACRKKQAFCVTFAGQIPTLYIKEVKTMEDALIVDLYWARDEQALAETAAKFGTYCRKIADNILHSAHDAEECENDTWLAAWNSMPTNRPARLAPYLGRITRNLALDRFDKASAQKRGSGQTCAPLDELAECVAAPGGVEDSFDAAETGRIISDFLRTLPEETRNIFLRRYWYCDATADIAARYGLTESKVRVTLHRTRGKLAAYLQERGAAL